jgi:hypothetical protein
MSRPGWTAIGQNDAQSHGREANWESHARRETQGSAGMRPIGSRESQRSRRILPCAAEGKPIIIVCGVLVQETRATALS